MVQLRFLITWMLPLLAVSATAGEALGRAYDVIELAPGVYSVIWRDVIAGPVAIGNSTFIIGDESVVVVDATTLPTTARAVIAEIRARTAKPVRYVIATHWHEDHIAGAEAFRDAWPAAELVAHPMTRRDFIDKDIPLMKNDVVAQEARIHALEAKSPRSEREESALPRMRALHDEMAALRFDLPTLLVPESLTLMLGRREVSVRHLGIGNTRGDLVVLLPAERIAITGDLAILPMQFALGSDIGPWLGTLDRLAALPASTWVPGHGPVQHDNAYIRNVRGVLQRIYDAVAQGVRGGRSLEELQRTIDVPEYRAASGGTSGIGKQWYDDYFLRPAIERSYAELKERK